MQLGRAGNRHDPRFLREQPGKRDLRRRRLLAFGDLSNEVDERLIVLARLGSEARRCGAEIRSADWRARIDLAGEETGTERTPRNEADAKFLACGEHPVRLDVSGPQRIFALNRADGMDGMRAADGAGARFREAVVLHLPGLDQLLERAGDVLDRNLGVYTMLIEQVDGIDLQTLEARVDDFADMLGAAVDATCPCSIRVDPEAELRGNADAVAEWLQRSADDLLVGPRAIDFGGVEMGDPALERRLD